MKNESLKPDTAFTCMSALDLLKWLEYQRTILFNKAESASDEDEYMNAMDLMYAINKTLKYIELSKPSS